MKALLLFLGLILSIPLIGADSDRQTITVVGQGKAIATASIVDVQLGIENQGANAAQVQQDLAKRIEPITDMLKQQKIQKVSTAGIHVYPQYSKDDNTTIIGYTGTSIISFTANVEQAGPLIDMAFKAGANRLQNLAQHPSEQAAAEAQSGALKMAANDALDQARTVLSVLGLKQKEIYKITVSPSMGNGPRPFYAKAAMRAEMQNTPTQLMSEEQETSVTITLEIEYQ